MIASARSSFFSLGPKTSESNSANTNILPGESLIIQLGNDGTNKSFQIANGKTWYHAKSIDGKKKGWIREDEFGWIINPNS